MAAIDRKGADDAAVRGDDGRGPSGSQGSMPCRFAPKFPERVGLDVGDRDSARQVHGGGAGTVADADGRAVHCRHELARQIRRDAEGQRLPFVIQQVDRATAAHHDAFDQFAYRSERRGQRRVGGDFLEDPALARRDRVGALALGNVGDAGADQPPIGTRQAHEAHLARHDLSRGVAVRPLEHRRIARQRALYEAARRAEGRRTVGLVRGTDLVRAAGEQDLPRHLEKAACVVVDVDEPALVDVENHDHFGGVLHQRSVARLTFAHRLLGEMPFGDVANADDVAVAPIEFGLADGDLDRDPVAALGTPPCLVRREVDVRIVDLGGQALEKVVRAARDVRQQELERAAENLRLRVAENALTGGVEGLDVAGIVHRDDGVLDVVQNGLQVRGGLLANFARERLRLVGHELHRAHDAAPFTVDPIVVGTDSFEQRVDIQLAASVPRLRDLALEQVVQAVRRRRRLANNCGRGIA